MIERCDLLDSNFLPGRLVKCGACTISVPVTKTESDIIRGGLPDNAISTLANYILDIVLVRDVERDFARSTWWWSWLTRHGGRIQAGFDELLAQKRRRL